MMKLRTVTMDFLKKTYPRREKWSHKGDSGRVLIIGGSRRYRGAPALCGLAALRSGCDIATIAAPESAVDVISSFSPNLITEPLVGDYINIGDLEKLISLSKKFDVILIGNGMGRMVGSRDTVLELLSAVRKPCIIDADALHMVSENKKLLRPGWILTPHEYEFQNLSGVKVPRQLEKRAGEVVKFSKSYRSTVLLKGHIDVIAESGKVFINSTGNPYMTVGGTGDVLAGICAAFLGGGMTSLNAAAAAAFVSGAAGDLAAKDIGPGLMATDVIEKIPAVMKEAVL